MINSVEWSGAAVVNTVSLNVSGSVKINVSGSVKIDDLILVISCMVHKGSSLWCLICELIFHFIADLSISNNTNDLICMTGFVTGQI